MNFSTFPFIEIFLCLVLLYVALRVSVIIKWQDLIYCKPRAEEGNKRYGGSFLSPFYSVKYNNNK